MKKFLVYAGLVLLCAGILGGSLFVYKKLGELRLAMKILERKEKEMEKIEEIVKEKDKEVKELSKELEKLKSVLKKHESELVKLKELYTRIEPPQSEGELVERLGKLGYKVRIVK